MKVSVIIVNYKTKELTRDAINSVIEHTCGFDYEIIVVDNDSKDGSADYLMETFGNKIKIIDAGSNLGFGRANNLAIKHAEGKYVFLLNPDTRLLNDAVNVLYEYMEFEPNTGASCGNLYDENLKPAFSFNLFQQTILYHLSKEYLEVAKSLLSKITKITKNIPYYQFNYSDKAIDVGFISGADMFIRASVLKQIGVFDENIFMYGEDVDLSTRIIKYGYKLKSVPEAKIIHFESQSVNNIEWKYRMMISGIYRFYFKTYGKWAFLICLNFQIFDSFRMYFRLIMPEFIFKKYFPNINSVEFYKDRIKINRLEYENATLQRRADNA